MVYAGAVAEGRRDGGAPSPNDTPDAGTCNGRVHLVGVMAEMAVCLHYGEPYQLWVTAHDERPGAIPDLLHKGYRVSVKGRERWESPLDLVVPSYDTRNDIYVLVSVSVDEARCGLRGWITRDRLLTYPAKPWMWTADRPGARRPAKLRRYVPVEDLRPCRDTALVLA